MRALALILSVIGLLLLFVVADLRWGFVPLRIVGLESGLIVLSLAFFAGLTASALATVFAFVHFLRARVASSRWLLAWCCVLVFSFATLFVV